MSRPTNNQFTILIGAHSSLEATLSKGDFSGTIGDVNGVIHNITGSFETVRLQ